MGEQGSIVPINIGWIIISFAEHLIRAIRPCKCQFNQQGTGKPPLSNVVELKTTMSDLSTNTKVTLEKVKAHKVDMSTT